ncbi:MAG: ADP-ribosylglycohydrolase family protein [Muribaculaceae bacterium]|nr:ADP-ribosylglycohydrolase family protein [Muribaculaceae bacterium]
MEKNKNLIIEQLVLRGAICGDIIGSTYEFHSTKKYDFPLNLDRAFFTDDTVCSIAVADAFLTFRPIAETVQKWCRKYPNRGYGGMFKRWISSSEPKPYNSFGNGSAMRVSSVGALASTVEQCLDMARESAEFTHNHPEGIKGAQAVALAIFMALRGASKDEIARVIEKYFNYDLSPRYSTFQPSYIFSETCQESVPEAIIAFLASDDYESTVRRAVALGGDADTQAAIAGGIAAAYYGEIPEKILGACMAKLPEDMRRVIDVYDKVLNLKQEI